MKKKYIAAIAGSFVVCPCPVHGSLIALTACGALFCGDKLKKKQVDKSTEQKEQTK